MKIFLAFSLVLLVVIVGSRCNQSYDNKQFMDHLKVDNGFLEVKETSVVFLFPDSIAMSKGLERIKKEYGEDGIVEVVSDESTYRAKAKDFIAQKGKKIIETDKKVVLFVNEKGEKFKVENTAESIGSIIYFFDVKKQPQKVESVATLTDGKEFESYFSNQ